MNDRPSLYLDVTQSAVKGGRSGIPRMGRELLRALEAEGAPAAAAVWEEPPGGFARPGFFHRRNLRPPETGGKGRARAKVPFWQRWWRTWTRRSRLLPGGVPAGSWLVLMETFGDGRIEWLRGRAARPGRPVAAVFHDGIALTHPEWIPERNRKRFAAYAASLALCDVVICISRESRDDLARFWEREAISPAPLVVLPWPVTGVRAVGGANAGTIPDGGVPAIFSVSTLEPRKNHLSLLRACEALWAEGRAFRLVLAGQALPRGSEEVLAEIARLREKGRSLEWLREVDDAVLAGAYRACLFTVYPSLKEGFGLPVLESLAFGKACVCSDRGAIAEAAAGGGCLQVDVARPEALAAALRLLLESPAERRRLEEEAASRRYLTWPEYVPGFLSALEGAAARPSPLPIS